MTAAAASRPRSRRHGLRFRPILMTSLAFIFGVVPLVWATGAGAELRQTLGTAVFSGMIGVTAFGLIFTPVFYVVSRGIASRREAARRTASPKSASRSAVMADEPEIWCRAGPAQGGRSRCCAVAANTSPTYAPAGSLHAVVVRSSHAHARFSFGDLAAVRAMPGVRLVLTAPDVADLAPLPTPG